MMGTKSADAADAKALLGAGRFVEIVRNYLPELARGSLTVEHRLILARALLNVGNINLAETIASEANEPQATALVRSRSELILGIIAKGRGDFREARRRLQLAVRQASEAGHAKQEAWCQISLFRLLAQGEPPEVLRAVFDETRRVVIRAADPHLTAYLHDSVALLESQTGRLDEARRHLGLVASILDRYPNAWLQQVMHTSQVCVACLSCDVVGAASHAEKARQLARITAGDTELALDINEAYINVFAGKFGKAYPALQRVLKQAPAFAKVSALESLARMHLALNRLNDCESTLQQMSSDRIDPSLANCYAARWAATTRTKLLIRRGLPQLAAEYAASEAAQAQAVGDRALVVTLTVLRAEALAEAGQAALASRVLLHATQVGALDVREYLGQYFLCCSRVLATESSALAGTFTNRAQRLWRLEGNVWARIQTASRNQPELPIRDIVKVSDGEIDCNWEEETHPRLAGARVLSSICAAFDVALEPRLVSAEMQAIANALGCAAHVAVSPRPDAGSSHPVDSTESHAAVLSGRPSESVELRCTVSDDVLTNLVLGNILRLARAVDALATARREERQKAALWPQEHIADSDGLFLSDEMLSLAATARKVAPTTVPVLITGETGTGKEILARAIHAASHRAKAIFLPFNCSAGPRDMIDAQLFGHRRGAFTGATEHAPGIIRAAAGGTLFLDEIGESPLEVQPKLLRFLESGEIHPVGEPLPVRADARVIAATNVDLDAAVSSGRFREDLFYRLNIVRLHLPPLRERRVEIPAFAHHYLRKHAHELGKGDLRIAEETMEYLLLFKWPGNVRQLANEMRRLAALAETDAVLMPEHLSSDIVAARRTVPASERPLDPNEVVVRIDQPLAAATEHLERAMLPYAMKQCGGRVEEAAKMLGLSRKGLYLKRVRLGLEPPESHARTA